MLIFLTAYVLADLLSGVYHELTDRGYGYSRHVREFQIHHCKPDRIGMDLTPFYAGIPVCSLGYFHLFFLWLGLFLCLTQITHYYAHHPQRANWSIRELQQAGIILSSRHHQGHHRNWERNYCVLSGWNNGWYNWIGSKLWRN